MSTESKPQNRRKKTFRDNPVHEVSQWVKIMGTNGQPKEIALLKCGHLVDTRKSKMLGHGGRQHGVSCSICGKELAAQKAAEKAAQAELALAERQKKKAARAPRASNDQALAIMKELAAELAASRLEREELKARLEQLEDVRTAPTHKLEVIG